VKEEPPLRYWRARQIHVIHPDGDRTLCGTKLIYCSGEFIPPTECTCRGCARVIDTQEQRRLNEERWQLKAAEYQKEAEQRNREWWEQYTNYLQSPAWQERRAAVLRRAKNICEGCGQKQAVHVHHTTYRHVFNEPLFELVALCFDCHSNITSMDRSYETSRSIGPPSENW
jgi:5-methylcytosine-specific restriction endonuclease McrA